MGRRLIVIGLCTLFWAGPYDASANIPSTGTNADQLQNRINPEYQRISRKAKVELGPGTVEGMCSKSDIKRRLRRRMAGFKVCYQEAFNRGRANPGSGSVAVSWAIDDKGRVRDIWSSAKQKRKSRTSFARLNRVGDCVEEKISRMRFTEPSDDVCLVRWRLFFDAPKERPKKRKRANKCKPPLVCKKKKPTKCKPPLDCKK